MILGIDIGGTKIAAGIVRGKQVQRKIVIPTPRTKPAIIAALRDIIISFPAGAIGIGVPGYHARTRIVNLPHLAVLNGTDLSKALRKRVVLANDALCFTVAEQRYGAARGKKNVVGITLGTGVGSGVILNGVPYIGSNGHTPELGQTYAEPQGHVTFESLLCGEGILRRYRARGGRANHSHEIFSSDTKVASATVQETITILAALCYNAVKSFEPERIVLGGGISNARLVQGANRHLRKMGLKPLVVLSDFNVDAGIIGAALMTAASRR